MAEHAIDPFATRQTTSSHYITFRIAAKRLTKTRRQKHSRKFSPPTIFLPVGERGLSLILTGGLFGCSEPTVSKDGSTGALRFGTHSLGDICVVVHKKDGTTFQQLGFGTTDGSGKFFLLKTGGQEALILEPGDYTFTLEPVGPQIAFPPVYLQPEKSPLKSTWTADMTSLDLNAPEELLKSLPK